MEVAHVPIHGSLLRNAHAVLYASKTPEEPQADVHSPECVEEAFSEVRLTSVASIL
jgi:hypothetical protein